MTYTQHALSAAFPAMSDADFSALVNDIGVNGLIDPITTLDGEILDGWHRYNACSESDTDPVFVEYLGADPRTFVESKNDRRRHMTASQRAASKVSREDWRDPNSAERGRQTNEVIHKGAELHPSSMTNKQMADFEHVSERTIKQAKAATKAGIGKAVIDGKISAERGAEIAKLPEDQRQAAVDDPKIKPEKTIKQAPQELEDDCGPSEEELAESIEDDAEYRLKIDEIISSDDRLAAADTEIKRQLLVIRGLEARITGLQNEAAAAKRSAQHWERKAKAAQL